MVRPGYTLVEAIVALVLLSCGVLAVAAALASAAGNISAAAAEEQAAAIAGVFLDSIVDAGQWHDGSDEAGAYRLAWTTFGPESAPLIELTVELPAGRRPDRLVFAVRAAPSLPPAPADARR